MSGRVFLPQVFIKLSFSLQLTLEKFWVLFFLAFGQFFLRVGGFVYHKWREAPLRLCYINFHLKKLSATPLESFNLIYSILKDDIYNEENLLKHHFSKYV